MADADLRPDPFERGVRRKRIVDQVCCAPGRRQTVREVVGSRLHGRQTLTFLSTASGPIDCALALVTQHCKRAATETLHIRWGKRTGGRQRGYLLTQAR